MQYLLISKNKIIELSNFPLLDEYSKPIFQWLNATLKVRSDRYEVKAYCDLINDGRTSVVGLFPIQQTTVIYKP